MMMSSEIQKKKVQTYFDTDHGWQGDVYTAPKNQFGEHVVRRKYYNLKLLGEISGLNVGTALDIGCGSGVYLPELLRMGFQTYGMDYSLEMVKKSMEVVGQGGNGAGAGFLAGDIEAIPCRDGSFDLILCVGVLGYLLRDEKAVREMYRVLRPGGFLIINLSNTYQIYNLDSIVRNKLRSLFGQQPPDGIREEQPGISVTSRWHLYHSPTKYRFKTYNLWRFEGWMKSLGYHRSDAMTFGHSFAFIRRFKLLPVPVIRRIEIFLEKFFRKVHIPYFSYSGATYIGIFRKPSNA